MLHIKSYFGDYSVIQHSKSCYVYLYSTTTMQLWIVAVYYEGTDNSVVGVLLLQLWWCGNGHTGRKN